MFDRIFAGKKRAVLLLCFVFFYIGLYYFSGKALLLPLREQMKLLQGKVQEIKSYYDPLGAQVQYVERTARDVEAVYRQRYQALLEKVAFQRSDVYRIPPDERSPKNYFRKIVIEFKERLQGYQVPFLPDPLQEPDPKGMETLLAKMAVADRAARTLKEAGISHATFLDIQFQSEEASGYLFIDRLNRSRLKMTGQASLDKIVKWIASLKQPDGFFFLEQIALNPSEGAVSFRADLVALQPSLKERLTYTNMVIPHVSDDD